MNSLKNCLTVESTQHTKLIQSYGPFKCFITLFSANFTPTHPLKMLITLNHAPS